MNLCFVLVVSCFVSLFLLCVRVCDLFLFLQHCLLFLLTRWSVVKCLWEVFVWELGVLFLPCVCVGVGGVVRCRCVCGCVTC